MAKQNLSDAIEEYIRFRKSQGLAKRTVNNDNTTLTRFLAANGNIWCHQIGSFQVTKFFEDAAKTRRASSLVNDHVILTAFFEWCRQTKRMALDCDPMYGRRKPKGVERERDRVHVSKFPALLEAAGERSPRDRFAIAVLLYTLIRDGEAADLRIRDLDLDAGLLRVRVHKSGLEDRMPICVELDAEARLWLTHYATMSGTLQPNWYLIPSRSVTPVWNEQRSRIIRNVDKGYRPESPVHAMGELTRPVLEDIGFPTRDIDGSPLWEGAHTIRRSGARALFDVLVTHGYDNALRIVQSMLHHKSMTTTERYIGITADRRSRDELLRGRVMFDRGNVIELRSPHGQEDRSNDDLRQVR